MLVIVKPCSTSRLQNLVWSAILDSLANQIGVVKDNAVGDATGDLLSLDIGL